MSCKQACIDLNLFGQHTTTLTDLRIYHCNTKMNMLL